VSVLVIVGLLLARAFGWLWMDPLAGIIGACVIASWSYGLIRDTGAVPLDMNPDRSMAGKLRQAVEDDGDRLADLHLWRLGPRNLGGDCFGRDGEATGGGLLSEPFRPLYLAVASDRRGDASILTSARRKVGCRITCSDLCGVQSDVRRGFLCNPRLIVRRFLVEA
jgi:hypothetical protein